MVATKRPEEPHCAAIYDTDKIKAMIKKLLLLFAILCNSLQILYAQQVVSGEVRTDLASGSNTTSGSSAADVTSVDPYSGVGTVNIPIYAYSVDDLNLGISLGYSTKGIRVSQVASDIGLGWDLNAGGSITRVVNGIEDEVSLPSLVNGIPPFVSVPIENGAWFDPNQANVAYYNGTFQKESSVDVFQANFAGRSIKFTYDPYGSNPLPNFWTTSEEDHVSIDIYPWDNVHFYNNKAIYDLNDPSNCFGRDPLGLYFSFVITDENGDKFYFDPGDRQEKWYKDERCSDGAKYYPVTKWVLTKIVTYENKEIDYTYSYRNNIQYAEYRDQQVKEKSWYAYDPFFDNVHHSWVRMGGLDVTDSNALWKGTVACLSEIKYPNGVKATFYYDNTDRSDIPGMKALTEIKVSSEYDDHVKNALSYRMNHAYFNTPSQNNNSIEVSYPYTQNNLDPNDLRLKLTGISKIGTDDYDTQPFYTFEYNTTSLPSRMSYMQDYYGYFNNKTTTALHYNNTDYYLGIPYHSSTVQECPQTPPYYDIPVTFTYGMSKSPDFTYAQADVLTKVKNGTGGETTFYYKDGQNLVANDPTNIYDKTSTNIDALNETSGLDPDIQYPDAFDGLIVDKTTSYDGFNTANNSTIQYDYANGERFFIGGYFWYPITFTGSSTLLENLYKNTIVSPQDYPNGNNHGFKETTVTRLGLNNEQLGKTKYSFSGMHNLFYPNALSPNNTALIVTGLWFHTIPPAFFYSQVLGLNTQTEEYDKDGNLTYKNVNNYDICCTPNANLPDHFKKKIIDVNQLYRAPISPSTLHDGYVYKHAQIGSQVIATTHITLANNIVSRFSNHIEYKDTFIHSYDSWFRKTDTRYADSKWEYWHKSTEYYQGNLISNQSLTREIPMVFTGTYVDYQELEWGSLVHYVTGVRKSFLSGISDQTTRDNYKQIVKEYTRDDKGNVLQSERNNLQDVVSYTWDPVTSQKTAQVINAKYTDIAYTSFEGGASNYNANLAVQDYGKGNWVFPPANIACYVDINGNPVTDKPITGSYFYNLPAAGEIYSYNNLTTGKKYFISFWTNSANAYAVNPSGVTNATSFGMQAHVGIWYLYTATVTGTGSQLHLTNVLGNALKMDELRLHPVEAGMDTYTYQPLFGISSHCNERNNITYYEYDAQGHLKVVRDIDGNVLSLTKYVTQGTDN
jgi:YD repeat-containing protein